MELIKLINLVFANLISPYCLHFLKQFYYKKILKSLRLFVDYLYFFYELLAYDLCLVFKWVVFPSQIHRNS